MKWFSLLIAATVLTGCYETGYEKQQREKLEERVKRLLWR